MLDGYDGTVRALFVVREPLYSCVKSPVQRSVIDNERFYNLLYCCTLLLSLHLAAAAVSVVAAAAAAAYA